MQTLHPATIQPLKLDSELQRQLNFQFLTAIKGFFTLLTTEGNLDAVDELSSILVHSRAYELAAESMKIDPNVANLITERYSPPAHNLEQLLTLPSDSLGYVYASRLKELGLQRIDLEIDINSDTAYIEYRWQQTHDIWHIITGFGVSNIEEIGLQAFYLAQFRLPLAGMLIANALISMTLLTPEDLPQLLHTISQGWMMGLKAKLLFAQRWEDAWEKPLSQWQAELNIQPFNATVESIFCV
ncbi:ubiquinone biosynthesis protein [Tolypothrix sp. FACHB-123]|uniref:Coq4 family protein n=1 Tax=Tolypothrix sp. FACHB-123 TaxID=2692868 RepID=UPI0016870D2B|nr:Coq4 family protein [Tolypothrix sp. FACHB-123]MBD2355149.1 ubiquinone biosynthesis protein [Tolypothrix sp. FACHB-123]